MGHYFCISSFFVKCPMEYEDGQHTQRTIFQKLTTLIYQFLFTFLVGCCICTLVFLWHGDLYIRIPTSLYPSKSITKKDDWINVHLRLFFSILLLFQAGLELTVQFTLAFNLGKLLYLRPWEYSPITWVVQALGLSARSF